MISARPLARHLLWVDCTAGAVAGVAVLALAEWLSRIEGVPLGVLRFTGAANLVYAAYSFSLAVRARRSVGGVLGLVAANAAWAVVCVALALAFGTRSGATEAANGLDFATALSDLENLEGTGAVKVKMVRALTDWDSGTTRLVISDETLGVDSIDEELFAITLNGERLVFDEGGNPVATANENEWTTYF